MSEVPEFKSFPADKTLVINTMALEAGYLNINAEMFEEPLLFLSLNFSSMDQVMQADQCAEDSRVFVLSIPMAQKLTAALITTGMTAVIDKQNMKREPGKDEL